MKNYLKTGGILLAALVFFSVYSCQKYDNSKFDGTTLKLHSITILIPKSFKLSHSDSSIVCYSDSVVVGPPPPPKFTVTISMDSVVVGPPPKGGK